jgi:hypothetical protein
MPLSGQFASQTELCADLDAELAAPSGTAGIHRFTGADFPFAAFSLTIPRTR